MPINDYCTLAEFQSAFPNLSTTVNDPIFIPFMESCITRASRAIDRKTWREAGAFYVTDDTTQYFQPYIAPNGAWCIYPSVYILDMAADPTAVYVSQGGTTAGYTLWPTTNYWMYPYNALLNGRPYYRIDVNTVEGAYQTFPGYPRCVKIVGKFGFSTTPPDDITQITIIQAGRWFKRGQLAYQDKVAFMDKMPSFSYMNAIDHDFESTLVLYKRARLSTTAGG